MLTFSLTSVHAAFSEKDAQPR